jgi:cell wall-associated NlpC family hydrolase
VGIILIALLLVLALLTNGLSSCAALAQGSTGMVAVSTYPSTDQAMLGAEEAYCAMEAQLQAYLDSYEDTHDYDEYHYDLEDIEHDPHVLISYLTAWFGGEWTLEQAQSVLETVFENQYTLTETVETEVRYRTETRTETREVTDPVTGETVWEEYETEVQVPYDYFICTVKLENFNLSHLPVYTMSESQMNLYAVYMSTLGNRPDLFPSSDYVTKYINGNYTQYTVAPEALEDEVFAAMLAEAEKYLGYPYVWGGSSPSTSFDCSGYVSWVINHSGWSYGRLGATALYSICTPVSTADAKPGDLVFFVGTYATTGMSHVGIYVGDGWMIHCGDPIQYANLNTTYWQSHLYGYGRLPAPTGG